MTDKRKSAEKTLSYLKPLSKNEYNKLSKGLRKFHDSLYGKI
jgi:hypothetical protein